MPVTVTRVNPHTIVPKYYQLYEILRELIENGRWEPHQAIPSERELERLYDVSRTTVRQALEMLVDEGKLYRSHGKGTFVARPKLQYSLQRLTSFTDDIRMRGLEPGQRLLELARIEPPDRIRQQLKLTTDTTDVLQIERLRLADGEPIGIDIAYVALKTDQEITGEELLEAGSLYALLASRFKLIVEEADETIEAVLANEREAELLEVPLGSPLLLIERTTWCHLHHPIELVKMLYRADRYKFAVHIKA